MWIIIIALILGFLWALGTSKNTAGQVASTKEHIAKSGINVTRDLHFEVLPAKIANRIVVDDVAKNLYVYTYEKNTTPFCIPYSKLLGYEVFENAQSVGGIKRAVVGGALAGGVGAIVGANTANKKITSMNFVIYQSDIATPQITLRLIPSKDYSTYVTEAKGFSLEAGALIKAIIGQS